MPSDRPKVVLKPGEHGPQPLPPGSLERLLDRVRLNRLRATYTGLPPVPGWPTTEEEAREMAALLASRPSPED